MKRIINSLVIALLVGSSAFASEELASLFLKTARQAEKKHDSRTAIYCLTTVLLDDKSNRSRLHKNELIDELASQFRTANLIDKSMKLKTVKGKELTSFLEAENDASDPTKAIEIFSDGTFSVIEKEWNSPAAPRKEISYSVLRPTVYRPSDKNYKQSLASYWWFKLPSAEILKHKPKYIQRAELQISGPDGAFK